MQRVNIIRQLLLENFTRHILAACTAAMKRFLHPGSFLVGFLSDRVNFILREIKGEKGKFINDEFVHYGKMGKKKYNVKT